MEDKIYDLLERMHIEFSSRFDSMESRLDGMESRFDGMEGRFDGVESRLGTLEKGQQKLENIITRLENKVDNNSKALFDGYQQTYVKAGCSRKEG